MDSEHVSFPLATGVGDRKQRGKVKIGHSARERYVAFMAFRYIRPATLAVWAAPARCGCGSRGLRRRTFRFGGGLA